MNIPKDVPAKDFWSIVVYDPQTRSELQTGQRFPSKNNERVGLVENPDGSIDLYFGPTAPKGHENNWIETVPGKGWFAYLRLYGPLDPWFDKDLASGRNHHTTNTGSIMESSTGFPGNTGQVPNSIAPLAEMLRLNGYSTGAFGKWHETAAWETSAEGGFVGMYNEMTYFNGVKEEVADLIPLIDEWGGPYTFPHMAAGWAVAFDAPFSWTKQVASNFGGTRNGMVIRWPEGIKEGGGLRTQFSHVIDIAPTILEAAKLPEPKSVNGTMQTPIEGTSLLYTFNNGDAQEQHTTQYFEMFGNRAIYRDGWLARTLHRAPWKTGKQKPLQDDVWDLYNVREDFSLTNNLAAQCPEKLKEMQGIFMIEAEKYHVLPIDDRTIERMNPAIAGRPDLLGDRTSLTLYDGMDGMLENTFMNVKNRSMTITAELVIPSGGADGVILAQGGRFGGWCLYMKDGKPVYTYNYLGLDRYTIASTTAVPAGKATVVLDFVYDGGGIGKGGMATLLVNGQAAAEGRIEKTQPLIFSADETADVGLDNQTPVAEDIGIGRDETRFTGTIDKIVLEVKDVK